MVGLNCIPSSVAGETLLKVVPISIALGVVFAVLTHWWACNPGSPGGGSARSSPTSLYWFMIPLGARFVRIGLMVMGAALLRHPRRRGR